MRLSASLLLAAVAVPFSVSAAAFPDVPASHENYDAIEYMKAHAIVDGYPDGSYRPMQGINRGEFTKIIMNALFDPQEIAGCPARNPGRWFTDVGGDEWFAPYVCFAKEKGIVSGLPDGSFHPGSALVFTEANKILANSFGLTAPDAPAVAGGIWYKTYVEALASKNALPRTVKKFSDPVRRGEIAEMAYRLKENITDKPSLTYGELAGEAPAAAGRERYTAAHCAQVEDETLAARRARSEGQRTCSAYDIDAWWNVFRLEARTFKFCTFPAAVESAGDAALSAAFSGGTSDRGACAALGLRAAGRLSGGDGGYDRLVYGMHLERIDRGCATADDLKTAVHAELRNPAIINDRQLELSAKLFSASGDAQAEAAVLPEYQAWFETYPEGKCLGL